MKEEDKEGLDAMLHVEHRKEINDIRHDVENLLKADMHLDHKMDMVMQAQKQLDVGFGHSRETGHKTWEAVQKMSANISNMLMTIKNQEEKLQAHADTFKRLDARWDKLSFGGIISLVLGLFGGLLVFLYRFNA